MTHALLALPAAVAVLALLVGPPPKKEKAPSRSAAPVAERDHIADFSLVDQNKKPVTREDLLGKVWIASFVVTHCPDGKCPQVTETLKQLEDELPDRPDLLLVTFTFENGKDPNGVNDYARRRGADPRRWLFLTGNPEEIDRVMRSCYLRGPKTEVDSLEHAQKLVLVDRQGKIRGWYDGLNDPNSPPGHFEKNLEKLRGQVQELLEPERPAYSRFDFPAFNATLNGISAALIFVGWLGIRFRQVRLHIACMLTALFVSAVFLASYLFYHLVVKQGQPTRFPDDAPDAVRYLYFAILFSHTILAVVATPLALYSAYLGLRDQLRRHTRIARWTLPIWLYVSCTGVVVYWMLYRLYPPGL